MMKLVVLILFLPSAVLLSQDMEKMFDISGKVADDKNNPIPYANIALFNNEDSTIIAGVVSDDLGKFQLSAKTGKYFLRITFLSYEEKIIAGIILSDESLNLGLITLTTASRLLEEVEIIGEKSQMELHLDKRVFNVGKDLSNISGSAAEILDNVPSVSVDIEGNVSLRGSQNVRILIDGKPSGLTGISTADALRQLQGNLIESIEVITNPSARYDAEGEVGILNIVLKKEKRNGVNGSFMASLGYPNNHGLSYTVNWRREKLNFFSSYGINYRSNPGGGKSYQKFIRPDSTFAYQQNSRRNRSGLSHNIRAGMDYFLNDKSTLTGSFLIRNSNGKNTSDYEYLDLDENNTVTRRITRAENEDEPELNSEVALSFRREFARKDRLFTADIKWIENIEEEKSRFTETDHSIDALTIQRSENSENERNLLAQTDYVHPFSENGKWEAGLKSTLRVLNNDFLVEQQNAEGSWLPLEDFNNNLIYTENIHAFYLMAGNEFNKVSLQGGLRGELTDIAVELKKTNEVNKQFYFNLFPSAHLSYKFTPDKTVQLSYSYRLSRPRFRDLIPFSNFSDRRAQQSGNPTLRPEYTNSFELGYLLNWETGSVLSSAYYRYRTGVIEDITVPVEDVDNPSQVLSREIPVNLSTENAYGLEFNFSWNPVEWWRFNSSANFYRAITSGQYEGQALFSDTYTWSGRATSMVRFFKKLDFQTGFRYRAPRQTPQGNEKSIFTIDLGMSRDVLKNKGTLTLSVRDLLNSRKRRSVIETDTYYSTSEFQWRARQILLTFTYRLNREKSRSDDDDDDRDDDAEGPEF